MSKKEIFLLKEFDATQVETRIFNEVYNLYEIGETPSRSECDVIRSSMRHVFHALAEHNKFRPAESAIARNKEIADIAIHKIGYRFALANHYMNDFFRQDYAPDYKGLIAAVICDDFISSQTNIDPMISANALKYWEEAYHVMEQGLEEDVAISPSMEAMFLVHINIFQMLAAIEAENLQEYDEESLESILEQLKPLHSLIHYGKDMGSALIEAMTVVENEVQLLLFEMNEENAPPPAKPPQVRAFPRLVYVNPSPENL
jgi:hypothetical protein